MRKRIATIFLPILITISTFGSSTFASTRFKSQGNEQAKIQNKTKSRTLDSHSITESSEFDKILERQKENNRHVLKKRMLQKEIQQFQEKPLEVPLVKKEINSLDQEEILSDLVEFHMQVKLQLKQNVKDILPVQENSTFYNLQMEEKLQNTSVIFLYIYLVAQTIESTLQEQLNRKILGLSGGFSGGKLLWDLIKDQLDRREKPRYRERDRYRERSQDDDGFSFPNFPLPFPPLVLFLTMVYLIKKYGQDLEKVPGDLLKKTFESKEDKLKRENSEAWNKFWKDWGDFFLAIFRFFINNPKVLPLIPLFFLLIKNRDFLFKTFANVKSFDEFSHAFTTVFSEGMKQSQFAINTINKYGDYAWRAMENMQKVKDTQYQTIYNDGQKAEKEHRKELHRHTDTKLKLVQVTKDLEFCEKDKTYVENEKFICISQLKHYYDYTQHIQKEVDVFNLNIPDPNHKLILDKEKKFVNGPPNNIKK